MLQKNLFLFFFICLPLITTSQEINEIFFRQPLEGSLSPSYANSTHEAQKNSNHYKFYLDSSFEYPELLIIVIPLTKSSDPDLYISQKNQYPSTAYNSEKICLAAGLDICSLDLKNMTLNTWVYISVLCYSNCSYNLKIDSVYLNESLLVNTPLIIQYNETTARIFKLLIQNNDNNTHILISLIPLNQAQINETFHVYVNKGEEIPSSSDYDYNPYQIWKEGKGIYISYNKRNTINSYYTILIEAAQGASLMITANINKNTRELFLNQSIQDIIEENEIQYYTFQLPNSNFSSIFFKLSVFSGNPNLFIHYNSKPIDLNSYEWNSLEEGLEGILIKVEDMLQIFNSNNGTFFIAVQGVRPGGYILEVFLNENYDNFIDFEEIISGELIFNEFVEYYFSMPVYSNDIVVIENIAKTGNVKIYVNLCCEQKQCLNTTEDKSFMKSEDHNLIKHLKFRQNSSQCFGGSESTIEKNQIYYSIKLIGSDNSQSSHYSLRLKRGEKHIDLNENQLFRGNLNEKENKYYHYSLMPFTKDFRALHIQINLISGAANVFFSRNCSFPNKTNYDEMYEYLDYIDISFTKESLLPGDYFIAIEAETFLDYSIMVLLEIDNKTIDYINLFEGQPLKIKFTDINQRFFFEFRWDPALSINNENCSLFINIKPIWGSFVGWVLEINNSLIFNDPSQKNYHYYIGEETYIGILYKEGVLFYRFMVEIDEEMRKMKEILDSSHEFQFSVMYSTCKTLITLPFNRLYTDFLLENQRKFYRFEYEKDEEKIEIQSKSENLSVSLNIWISFEENNRYPSYSVHDASLNNSFSDLTLNNKVLSNICTNSKKCFMYLGIEASNYLQFSLLVLRSFSPIKLNEGEIIRRPLLNQGESYLFSYEIESLKKTISLFYSCYFMNYHLYYSITKKSNSTILYPNETNHDFTYNGSFSLYSEIIIPKKVIQSSHCGQKTKKSSCILLLNFTAINNNTSIYKNREFVLLVSTDITPIKESHPLISFVEQGIIKYFSLEIKGHLNFSLIISVNALDEGSLTLLVSKGRNKRPSLENSQWRVGNVHGNPLKIDASELQDEKNQWIIIGIYGDMATSFVINVLYSRSIQNVIPGYFFGINLEKIGDYQDFEYLHLFQSDLKFILIKEKGKGEILVNKQIYSDNSEYLEAFPTGDSNNALWNGTDLIYISTKNINYCAYCKYLIRVRCIAAPCVISFSISLENFPLFLPNGRIFYDYIPKNHNSLYVFRTITGLMELSLTLLTGEIEIFVKNETFQFINLDSKNFTSNHLDVKIGRNFELLDYFPKENANITKDFQVMVKSIETSNFTIRLSSANYLKILRFGVTDYGNIGFNDSQKYRFSSHERNQTISIMLVLKEKNSFLKDFPTITMKCTPHSEKKNCDFKNFSNISQSRDSIIMSFDSEDAFYDLEISNFNSNRTYSYALLVNSPNIQIILSDSEPHLMSLPLNNANNFELYSHENKSLFIEIIECFGKVELKATQTYINTLSGEYDWEFQYPYEHGHLLAKYQPISQGPIFMQIKSIDINEDFNNNTLYLLRVFMIDQGQKVPHEAFFPGDSGNILWSFNENNELIVNFSTIETAKTLKTRSFQELMYVYTLHISKEQKLLNSYGRCELYKEQNEDDFFYKRIILSFESDKHPKKAHFKEFINEKDTLFITITGEIWGFYFQSNNYISLKVFYEEKEIKSLKPVVLLRDKKEFYKLSLVFLLGLLVFCVILACCCYYRRRKRIIQNKIYDLTGNKEIESFENKKADDFDQHNKEGYHGL